MKTTCSAHSERHLPSVAKKGLTLAVAGAVFGTAALLATSTGAAQAQEIKRPDKPVQLVFETIWPRSITLWRPDRYYVDLVNTLASGHVQIQYNDGGTFSSTLDMFDDVQAGSIDMGSDWPSYWEGRNTAFSLITSVPMIFSPNDYMTWFWQYGGYELSNEVYSKYNLKWIPHLVNSPEAGQRTNKPIRTADDYKGLRLRQCGRNQSRILDSMGASAMFTPGGEVYAALDRGLIDGAEFSVPEVDWSMGLHQVTKYVVKPGWHQPGPVAGMMFNKQSYEKLDDYTKFVLKQAAMSTMMWAWTFFEQTSGEYTMRFKEAGTEISRLEDDVLDRILALTEERILADANGNPDHAKLALSMYSYLVTMADWREYQRPFTHGWVWPSLNDTHAKLVAIAKKHEVYDHTMQVIADSIERNKAQAFWKPGTKYDNHPLRK
jgi:TRAP-type mannitol/chloroaromatic compound transport system substrate-binding protein